MVSALNYILDKVVPEETPDPRRPLLPPARMTKRGTIEDVEVRLEGHHAIRVERAEILRTEEPAGATGHRASVDG